MGIIVEEKRGGFTIIEVMLFLALSGFLLVGILAGAGSSVAKQRYKDAVQDTVDALRSAYSYVSDIQIEVRDKNQGVCYGLSESGDVGKISTIGDDVSDITYSLSGKTQFFNYGRGRTSCAVYGAVVSINGSIIQTTTLVGKDYSDMIRFISGNSEKAKQLEAKYKEANDLELLRLLGANNLAVQCPGIDADIDTIELTQCRISTVNAPRTQKLKWNAKLVSPINKDAGQTQHQDFQKTLLIFRSPRSGAIRTLASRDSIDGNSAEGFKLITYQDKVVDYNNYSDGNTAYSSDLLKGAGVYSVLQKTSDDKERFSTQEIKICVDNGDAQTYADHRRMIRIMNNAHSQSGVELVDMDTDGADQCD